MRESLESDQVGALVSVRGQVGNRAQTGHALDGWTGAQHVGCVSAAVAGLPTEQLKGEKLGFSSWFQGISVHHGGGGCTGKWLYLQQWERSRLLTWLWPREQITGLEPRQVRPSDACPSDLLLPARPHLLKGDVRCGLSTPATEAKT